MSLIFCELWKGILCRVLRESYLLLPAEKVTHLDVASRNVRNTSTFEGSLFGYAFRSSRNCVGLNEGLLGDRKAEGRDHFTGYVKFQDALSAMLED